MPEIMSEIQTCEQENETIVAQVIAGATPEEQIAELQRQLEDSRKQYEDSQSQLKEAQKTNLHLAMTMSAGEGNKAETFEDILRQQPYYRKIMEGVKD